MSFDPLPETLAELCRGRPSGWRGVDLGCGDGELTGALRRHGAWIAGLDSAPRGIAGGADLRGDARRPPLREGSLDLVVAGNLARHLLPADPGFGFLDAWLRLLRPGGSVFLLEDEPTAGDAAANHRDLQDFLARLAPAGRGPLVSLSDFVGAMPSRLRGSIAGQGVAPNRWELDARAAVAMLATGRPAPGGEAARLAGRIERHGLGCGDMWWLQLAAAGTG